MSEALSSSEIEDVLSSIRRLVSDDMRPSRPERGRSRAAPEADKLLLTPALRVVQADADDAVEGTGSVGLDGAGQEGAGLDSVALEGESRDSVGQDSVGLDGVVQDGAGGVAHLRAVVMPQDDEWEAEAGDLSLPNTVAEDVAAADWQDQKIDAYAQPMPEEAVEEAVEVVEADQGDVLTDAALPETRMPPGWAQTDDAEEADAPLQEAWVGGTVEPDQAWADEAEAAVLQELTGGAQPQSAQDAGAVDRGPDADVPVDEAMLREIVRDVLREELQGRLGERITRNIRKLVRAEIARVMAAEELY